MTRLWFRSALLGQGWAENVRLTLADGTIARIETGVLPEAEDERHAVALPGMPNVHSHAFQRAMAGLAEVASGGGTDSFWSWRETLYGFVGRLDPDDVEAIAGLAFAEMLESGFTRVGEFHYLHHDRDGAPYADPGETAARIAAAAEATGIGLTLLPVFYAHAGFGGRAPQPAQRRFVSDLDGYARLVESARRVVRALPDAVVGVAPHSLRAVTPEELAEVVPLAADGPIHIHAAEQTREVEDCLAWSGLPPVAWLLEHAPVDRRWCLVHATHVTDDEVRRLAASEAVAGLCPITEANLGDGIFPAHAYLSVAGRLGIGSDSNVLIDVAGELRMLEYGQRLRDRRRNVLAGGGHASTGRRLFAAALAGGAQALGTVGELGEGRVADVVSLDVAHPALAARSADALIDGWLFAAREPVVDCVWRYGRKVVSGGRHFRRDGLVARYRRTLERLLA